MVLTIGAIGSGNAMGPGTNVAVTNPAIGPIPIDDFVRVLMFRTSDSELAVDGFVPALASSFVVVRLGVYDSAGYESNLHNLVAAGDACTVRAIWYHANGVEVDRGDSGASVVYDPVGGLWMAHVASGGSGDDFLRAIYNAVIHTYSNV